MHYASNTTFAQVYKRLENIFVGIAENNKTKYNERVHKKANLMQIQKLQGNTQAIGGLNDCNLKAGEVHEMQELKLDWRIMILCDKVIETHTPWYVLYLTMMKNWY